MQKQVALISIFILLSCLWMTTGCSSFSEFISGIDKPSVRIADVQLQGLNLEKVDLVFHLEVSNPYSLPLPLSNLQYDLATREQSFLSGKANVQGTIPSKESKIVPVPVSVAFIPLLQVLTQIKPGAIIAYHSKLIFSVDAPGVGNMDFPLENDGELPIPALPDVSITSVQWQEFGLNQATANLNCKIGNPNGFPLELSQFDYRFLLGGTPIAEDKISQSCKFTENGSNELQIPISISPIKLGFAAYQMLQGNSSNYGIHGGLKVKTPFGPIDFPISREGETTMGHK